MAGEGVCGGTGAQVYEADGRVLRGTGNKEMLSYWRKGVRIDVGVEVEGGGAGKRSGIVQLQGVVIGGGQKGEGIEWVEVDGGNAKGMRGRSSWYGRSLVWFNILAHSVIDSYFAAVASGL